MRGAKVIGAAALLTVLAACGSTSGAGVDELPFDTVRDGYLTVTYSENYLPKIASDGDGLQGYEGFLVEKVAEKYGLKIQKKPVAFGSQILSVQKGQADMGTGIYYNEDRAKQVLYTKPNINDRIGFLMKESDPYEGPESLEGKPVGTVVGFNYNQYLIDTYGEENVKIYPEFAQALNGLLNGQIVAYAGSSGTGPGAIEKHPELTQHPMDQGDLGVPDDILDSLTYTYVNCDNPGLADAIDEVLAELIENGEWDKQRERWQVDGEEFDPVDERPEQFCG